MSYRAFECDIIALKTIVFTKPATKQLDSLEPAVSEAISAALAAYAISGEGNVKALIGARPGLRLRIGRYRALFIEDATTITVHYIGKRETTTYMRQ